jgi:hypothetical protein
VTFRVTAGEASLGDGRIVDETVEGRRIGVLEEAAAEWILSRCRDADFTNRMLDYYFASCLRHD